MEKYDFLQECNEIEESYQKLFGKKKFKDAWRDLEEEFEELDNARSVAVQQRNYFLLVDEAIDIMRVCYVLLRSCHHTHEEIVEGCKRNGMKLRNRLEDLRSDKQ